MVGLLAKTDSKEPMVTQARLLDRLLLATRFCISILLMRYYCMQHEFLVLLSVLTNWFKHDFSDGVPACDGWATCQHS